MRNSPNGDVVSRRYHDATESLKRLGMLPGIPQLAYNKFPAYISELRIS